MQRSPRSVLLVVRQLVLLLVLLPYQPVIVTAVINTQRTVELRSLEAGNGDNPLGTIDGELKRELLLIGLRFVFWLHFNKQLRLTVSVESAQIRHQQQVP